MSYYFDHLAATIIGCMVCLIIFNMQRQMQESKINRTQMVMAKTQSLELGQWVQRDLSNMGMGVPDSSVFGGSTTDGADNTTSFQFKRRADSTLTSAIVNVQYTLVKADSVYLAGKKMQVFRLERRVDGLKNGGSPPLLTSFRINFLDAGGNTVGSYQLAKSCLLQFSMALPGVTERTYVRETHFSTTLPIGH